MLTLFSVKKQLKVSNGDNFCNNLFKYEMTPEFKKDHETKVN